MRFPIRFLWGDSARFWVLGQAGTVNCTISDHLSLAPKALSAVTYYIIFTGSSYNGESGDRFSGCHSTHAAIHEGK